jgi:hypothetical protein
MVTDAKKVTGATSARSCGAGDKEQTRKKNLILAGRDDKYFTRNTATVRRFLGN